MSELRLDAEALYGELLRGVPALRGPTGRLVGILSGGAWLAERLQRDGDYEGASRVLYGEIPALEKEVEAAQQAESAIDTSDLMVKERVGADDIAEVISAWTGIPAGRLLQGETEKLLSMESIIGARLIGQAEAVAFWIVTSDAPRRH